MDQFEYVMVLVSIVVGLGVAHTLLGMAGLVDRLSARTRPMRLSVAYFAWLGVVFVWTLLFWWWEYRFSEFVSEWTIGLYFFLIGYAMVLFLMAAVLVPRSWEQVDDLGQYFVDRRVWFYSLIAIADGLDILDTYLKDPDYLAATPPITLVLWGALFAAAVIGLRAKDIRTHAWLGVTLLVLQILSGFDAIPTLVF